jgi:hypothetical protein
MANYSVGSTIAPTTAIPTGASPGSASASYGTVSASAPGKVIGLKTVNGQDYYNIDQSSIGGGTGWVLASAVDSASGGSTGSGASSVSVPQVPSTGNSDQVNSYLAQYQAVIQQAQDTLNTPQQTPEQIFAQVQSQIIPNTPAPAAPNLVDLFTSLTTSQGISDLETSLTNTKDQIQTIQDQVSEQAQTEAGKPVPTNVIAGRQSQEAQNAQVQLDFLNRRVSVMTDELSTRYNIVNTIMQLTQQDYTNAVQAYDTQVQQNLDVYNAFTGELTRLDQERQAAAQTVLTGTGQLIEWAKQDQQEQQAQANANLTVYANLIKSGNINYSDLSSDQQLQIQKLEVQAGMPTGFLESITSDNANGKLIYAGANGAVFQNTDGTLNTVNYNVSGGSGSGTATQQLAAATSEMRNVVQGALNSYGDISPADWNKLLNQWNNQGFSTQSFIDAFGQYADTNRGDFSSAYGFKNPNPQTKALPTPSN